MNEALLVFLGFAVGFGIGMPLAIWRMASIARTYKAPPPDLFTSLSVFVPKGGSLWRTSSRHYPFELVLAVWMSPDALEIVRQAMHEMFGRYDTPFAMVVTMPVGASRHEGKNTIIWKEKMPNVPKIKSQHTAEEGGIG